MPFIDIGLHEACVPAFEDLKLGKKLKYVVYKLSDDSKTVIVDKTGVQSSYDDFVSEFPADDCRWAIYDFVYSTPDGEHNQPVFYSWCPDDANNRMKYASSGVSFRGKLVGITADIQATDADEMAYEKVLSQIRRY